MFLMVIGIYCFLIFLFVKNQVFLVMYASKLENWQENSFWKSDDKVRK